MAVKVSGTTVIDGSRNLTNINSLNNLTYPSSDGTNGQVLTTNGTGTLSFTTITGYTDADVDTHLNTGTAASGEVLSWNGSDYDWVSGGGTPLGDGQSWQSVSRSSGTWYQNTTGRTIVFMCGLRADWDGSDPFAPNKLANISIVTTQSFSNPISAPQILVSDIPSYNFNTSLFVTSIVPITLIIPSGYYYRVDQIYGSMTNPRELR